MANTTDTRSTPGAIARAILEANRYLTLGTADGQGQPWVSPVYYALDGFHQFYWVSSPRTQHSRNIAARPQISLVVFDSRAMIGRGQAVYMRATARAVDEAELEQGLQVFSARLRAHGERAWTISEVQPPARHRLYLASVSQHWILDPDTQHDERVPVQPQARAATEGRGRTLAGSLP